jgi:outer membrane protein OmpA-like peptidoglycan-associated protein
MNARYIPMSILLSMLVGCTAPGPHQAQNQPFMMMQPRAAPPPQLTAEDWAAEFGRFAATVSPEYAPAVVKQTVTIDGQSEGPPITLPVVRITFPDRIFFDFAVDEPRAEAGPLLDTIAGELRRTAQNIALTVLGHTDNIGSDAYNIDLSRRRAFNVMQALVVRGVDPQTVSIVAVGRQQPATSNDTEEGRAKNRRVEFLVSPTLAGNLTAIQYTPSIRNTTVEVYGLRPTGNDLDLAQVGSLALQSVTPGSLESYPTPGVPAEVAPRPVRPPSLTAPPNGRTAIEGAKKRASAPPDALVVPTPHYEPKELGPDVQVNPLGPTTSY